MVFMDVVCYWSQKGEGCQIPHSAAFSCLVVVSRAISITEFNDFSTLCRYNEWFYHNTPCIQVNTKDFITAHIAALTNCTLLSSLSVSILTGLYTNPWRGHLLTGEEGKPVGEQVLEGGGTLQGVEEKSLIFPSETTNLLTSQIIVC